MFYVYIFLSIIVVLVLISIPFAIISSRLRNKKLEKVFAGRQQLSELDLYGNFFEAKAVPFFIVQGIRRIFEEELGADFSRLIPEDDFSKNLSFFSEYDSLDLVEITMRIEEEFDIKISDEEASNLRTVDEIVNFVWQKVREKDESEH